MLKHNHISTCLVGAGLAGTGLLDCVCVDLSGALSFRPALEVMPSLDTGVDVAVGFCRRES